MEIKELFKILLEDKPSKEIKKHEKEIFDLIPELSECKGFKQNNEWHIYDVYEHTLHVLDNVPDDLTLRLAALFHDTGKPMCYNEDENGVGHFYGHWTKSMIIFERFAVTNKLDKRLSDLVSYLIYFHDANIDRVDIDNLHTIIGSSGIKQLYQLKKADLLAQNEKYHYILEDLEKQETKILKRYN